MGLNNYFFRKYLWVLSFVNFRLEYRQFLANFTRFLAIFGQFFFNNKDLVSLEIDGVIFENEGSKIFSKLKIFWLSPRLVRDDPAEIFHHVKILIIRQRGLNKWSLSVLVQFYKCFQSCILRVWHLFRLNITVTWDP